MFEHVSDSRFQWIAPPQASFLEISDWGIDDAVTRQIGLLLGARFRLQPIDVSRQDFDTWTHSSLARHLRELPVPEEPVDAYLLVLRDWRGDAIGNTDQEVGGLGLYRRDFSGGRERLGVFASYRLLLADPDTGAIIAEAPGLSAKGGLPVAPAMRLLWPRTQNDLSPAQQRSLRADFLKLIGETLPRTLRQIGLPALH